MSFKGLKTGVLSALLLPTFIGRTSWQYEALDRHVSHVHDAPASVSDHHAGTTACRVAGLQWRHLLAVDENGDESTANYDLHAKPRLSGRHRRRTDGRRHVCPVGDATGHVAGVDALAASMTSTEEWRAKTFIYDWRFVRRLFLVLIHRCLVIF